MSSSSGILRPGEDKHAVFLDPNALSAFDRFRRDEAENVGNDLNRAMSVCKKPFAYSEIHEHGYPAAGLVWDEMWAKFGPEAKP